MILAALTLNPIQWLIDRINEGLQNLGANLQPLINLIGYTPLNLTTHNPIIHQWWQTMVTVSDLCLGLFIVVGAIQMMYGDTVGSLRMPVGQFVGKAILTVLLIHLSGFLGEQLIVFTNLLSDVVNANARTALMQLGNQNLFQNDQNLILGVVLGVIMAILLFRIIFQAVMRVIRFNLLFILSGPAFLTSFHPATAPVFSSYIRLYVATAFEQFVVFLTYSLGFQFIVATRQDGLTGFILTIAMLSMTVEVPRLLERLGAGSIRQGDGLGSLANIALKTAILFG